MEGLHDAVRTYTRTILHIFWFPFCTARYREKQLKMGLLIYFMEEFEIFNRVCVLIF